MVSEWGIGGFDGWVGGDVGIRYVGMWWDGWVGSGVVDGKRGTAPRIVPCHRSMAWICEVCFFALPSAKTNSLPSAFFITDGKI